MLGVDEPEVDRGVAAVGDDRKQDVVALLGLALALFDLLDALRQNPLVGLEGGARRNGDDLALAARDPGEPQILSKLRLQDDVGEVPEHGDELRDIDELGEAGDGFVETRGLQFEVRGRLAEGGGPGVEFLNAAFGEHFGLEEPLDGEHLAERIGDRRAGGGDQRPHGRALRAEESRLDVEVPGALRPVRIDALQLALVGGEGELAELLHLIDDDLVDANLGDGQKVVLAGFQRLEPGLHAFLHPLDAFARDAVLGVDPVEKVDVGTDHVRDERPFEVGGRGDELERRMGDDDAVPIRRRGSGKEALTLVLHEIGLVGDQDIGGRVELQELARRLGKAVPGHGHHRLRDEAEPLLLHDRGGQGEGLSGPDRVSDIGRAGRENAPDGALLVLVEPDDAGRVGKCQMRPVEATRHEVVEPLVVDLRKGVGPLRVGPDPGLEGLPDLGELVLCRLGVGGVEDALLDAVLDECIVDLRQGGIERVRDELAGVAAQRAPVRGRGGILEESVDLDGP